MKKKSKHEKKNKTKIGKLLIILIALVVIIFTIKIVRKDKLEGYWTTDGNTIYQFDGRGNGALIVPSSKYIFSYKIKKNKVYIDFISDKANDSNYEFLVNKDTLTLTGIDGTVGTYIFKKGR